jgi:hypothetical protein
VLPEDKQVFFSEEKNQKTFLMLSRTLRRHKHLNKQKSFASFRQKRSSSFAYPAPAIWPPRPIWGNPAAQ